MEAQDQIPLAWASVILLEVSFAYDVRTSIRSYEYY